MEIAQQAGIDALYTGLLGLILSIVEFPKHCQLWHYSKK